MMRNSCRRRTFARWLAIATLGGALPAVVLAQATDKPLSRVAVASHEIARGVVLVHTDIGYMPSARPVDRSATAAGASAAIEPATVSDSLVGWMTRRLITAGEPLRAPAVVPPQLVKAGDQVDVLFQMEGVSVTMRGKATRAAAIGEKIVVRMDNQRRLEGTVIAVGRVRVN